MVVLGKDEGITDVPEYSQMDVWWPLANGLTWNERTRGVGATTTIPVSSCAEENLLCLDNDRYRGENICLHETAHTLHGAALSLERTVEFGGSENLDQALQELYSETVEDRGLWAGVSWESPQ